MLVAALVVVGLVVALTVARSLAGHWLVVLVKELAWSAFLLGRLLYRGGRSLVLLIRGEARTWSAR
ncbi:hypothetical protein [Catenulispora rubra]|uniref:hypothetical protein n=1 Tax=Catenulispora rubra TaxID=280293 RepID=UPI00189227B2|nr:hypothetical protein [Catenulispora rubra]